MSPYVVGQRFVSEAEPELGLGRVERVESRSLVLRFPASDTERRYASISAPLRRVAFRVGDEVEDESGRRIKIERVDESEGLLVYAKGSRRISESELSGSLAFSKPEDRLLAGLWDSSRGFEVRSRALRHRHALLRSEARGFLGGRIQLMPHQLGIAREVTSRLRPRALLADEVGLGKTIEAGLILHRLLRTGRANRVLILVPEPLVNQWFVEMYRRFHLSFTIADESSLAEVGASGNPFLLAQTFIAATSFLARDRVRRGQVEAADWDMVVVDEAHHLTHGSSEYHLVEALAGRAPGVLLLTATPEQLGEENHFERLRLLDGTRYSSYRKYVEDRKRYRALAGIAGRILDGNDLTPEQAKKLAAIVPRGARITRSLLKRLRAGDERARGPLLDTLVDQHGPGRVVFRNSRSVLARFPARKLRPWKLDWPKGREGAQWSQLAREFLSDASGKALPEYPYFFDARVQWLSDLLRELSPRKVVVICRFPEKVLALQEALRTTRTRAALFHEGLSLLARDRNAAWFAAGRDSAQVLLSSEIGSEGRNFQFAHHLVLFDLPLGTELLEQRIGRLYRIGQEHEVTIHVPYLPGSPQEMLLRFHHEGLGAFESGLPGTAAFDQLGSRLLSAAAAHIDEALPGGNLPDSFDRFLDEARALKERVLRELALGRDRLLEIGSFKKREAEALTAEIARWDEDEALDTFVTEALDHLGVDLERTSSRSFVFRQGTSLKVAALAGLRAGEVGMTSSRLRATREEKLDFLTWDHPMVVGILDLILGGTSGSASVALLPGPARGVALEAVFVLEPVTSPGLDASRFLPPTPIRTVVDQGLADVTEALSPATLEGRIHDGRKDLRYRELSFLEKLLPRMLKKARALARKEIAPLLKASLAEARSRLGSEASRLRSLQEVNDHVDRQEALDVARRLRRVTESIASAELRLDSLRLIWQGNPKDRA